MGPWQRATRHRTTHSAKPSCNAHWSHISQTETSLLASWCCTMAGVPHRPLLPLLPKHLPEEPVRPHRQLPAEAHSRSQAVLQLPTGATFLRLRPTGTSTSQKGPSNSVDSHSLTQIHSVSPRLRRRLTKSHPDYVALGLTPHQQPPTEATSASTHRSPHTQPSRPAAAHRSRLLYHS